MAPKPPRLAGISENGTPAANKRHQSMSAFLLDDQQRERMRSGDFDEPYDRLKAFFEPDHATRRRAAVEAIQRLILSESPPPLSAADKYALTLSWETSTLALPGYATLAEDHTRDIFAAQSLISAYAEDRTRTRPLNFLLMASPGSGKSHFLNCISDSLQSHKVVAHSFNMASMVSADDLSLPLDEVRNSKVEDKLPLLFLDEFDTAPNNYGLLLPLLWDGGLSIRQRHLTLGKMIIVLAGSTAVLPQALANARSMRSAIPALDGANAKLLDLLSRINGAVIELPPLNASSSHLGRVPDKIAIAVQLLRRRFGSPLRQIPIALLMFVARVSFRYDVRSLSQLIDLIQPVSTGAVETLSIDEMPFALNDVATFRESSLIYHLVDEVDNAHGVINTWKSCAKHKCLLPLTAPPTLSSTTPDELKLSMAYAINALS